MGHHSDQPFDGDPEAFRKAFEEKTKMADAESEQGKAEMMEKIQSRQKLMRGLLDTTGFIGALGSHPEGKLTPADEGAIQFAIGEQNGKVVIDFGTPVHWLGMSAQQAADLAGDLMKWARLVGRKQGETIALTIGA